MGLVCKSGGIALAILAAVGWASLLSWSVHDPSLTHATGGAARNWLGPLGAILADLLLQTIGFAAIFAFLAAAAWGVELLLRQRMAGVRTRAGLLPLSLLILAGAFSSLPVPSSWPLYHGLGGIMGDAAFGFVSSVLGPILGARAGAVAGFLLFAGAACAQAVVLGLTQRDLMLLLQTGRHQHARDVGAAPNWLAGMAATIYERQREAVPRPEAREEPRLAWPEATEPTTRPAPIEITVEDPDFDASTDRDSRAIAERFAPVGVEPARKSAARVLGGLMSFKTAEPAYRRPSLNVLKRPSAGRPSPELTQAAMRAQARLLEDVLGDFGVKGEIKAIKPGPVVTLYELEPARGTKTSRVIALSDDIARSMSAVSARVATVPGRNVIGIELPNLRRETVYLRELLEADAFRSAEAKLPIVLGKSIGGDPIVVDLARMPHLLIAGTTGSGKSVGVNAMILSLLYRLSPEECRFLMIDPKMLELSMYNAIPHLLAPVVTDPHNAASALNWVVGEMEERYKRMSRLGVRSIEIFNNRVRNAKKHGERLSRTVQTGFDEETGEAIYERDMLDLEPMPYIVVVVDEFADLMIVAGKEVESAVQRLAQMARAAGIHLIMATQRPSVDVITGTIKANFPTRISFKVASKVDSRTILNEQGAEQLLGQGDMLYSTGSGQAIRIHGPYVSDEEVEQVAVHLRAQGEPEYVTSITDPPAPDEEGSGDREDSDDLYQRAVAIVLRDQKASTSYLQRRLSVGYNRAADLIERMEQEGLISPANAVGKRHILGEPLRAEAAAPVRRVARRR
ncbi:MAG TPA: DNA translocase FtsK 4TM domain-containing protein [Hyphomicrobiaceae bacterium]|nr:DNA translocase FtsK 4TM domain-containing protein [Hyphomicrobiaceae bacterium]